MRRAALLVAGSLVVAGAAYWFFGRATGREAGDPTRAVDGADAGGRRGPGAELAVPGARRSSIDEAKSKDVPAEVSDDQVPAPTVFRFQVYNAEDGTPVAGAQVERASGEALGTSDAYGRLEVEIVSSVYVSVRVHREGFVEWRGDPIGDRSHEPPTEATPRAWSVDLEPGVPVDGRVVLSTGQPVASATILVDSDMGDLLRSKGRGSVDRLARSTDREGRFHFEGLAAGLRLWLRVSAPGRRALERWVTLDRLGKELLLTMPDAGVVRGVVREADGRPSCGVVVWLAASAYEVPAFEDARAALAGRVPAASGDVPWGVTDADGTYSIAGLVPGEVVVPVVRAAEMLVGYGDPVTCGPPGTPQVRDVHLPRPAHLRVVLVVPPGDRGEETTVVARSDLDFCRLASAPDAGGAVWVASPLTPGSYDLAVDLDDRPRFRLGAVTLAEGEAHEIRAELPPSQEISGVVVDARDRPIPGVRVDWWTESVPPLRTSTDAEGAFRFRAWPATVGRIEVRGPSFPVGVTVENVAPGTTGLRVVLVEEPH